MVRKKDQLKSNAPQIGPGISTVLEVEVTVVQEDIAQGIKIADQVIITRDHQKSTDQGILIF